MTTATTPAAATPERVYSSPGYVSEVPFVNLDFLEADMEALVEIARLRESDTLELIAKHSVDRIARIRRELEAARGDLPEVGDFACLTPTGLAALRGAGPGPRTSAVFSALDRVAGEGAHG